MRKLLAVWALVALILAGSVFAETVVTMSDGSVFVEKPSSEVVSKKEVTFGSGVSDYGDTWKQAYAKPGTLVPVKTHTTFARDGLFHIVKTEVADVGIVYDGKSISLTHGVAGTHETASNPFVIFWLLSVAMMVFGIVSKAAEKDFAVAAFALVAAVAAVATGVAAGGIAATAATLAAVVAASDDKKMFYILVGIYGVSMAVSMTAFLLG